MTCYQVSRILATPVMESLLGQTISHYRITDKLGSGGMGVVYEAEDTRLGRRVALKFLPPELALNPESLERFRREARAASALNHPNICTIYAIEAHEVRHFIVMERLEGQSLAQLIGGQPMDIQQLLLLGMEIADVLESVHAHGIVHRDIKPANIFVTPRGHAKVLDFGLTKMNGGHRINSAPEEETILEGHDKELTSLGTTVGTVSYMSPEQARGELADARTDLFSFGTVLYQMASGALPFQGNTSAVIYEALLNRDPVPAAKLNPQVPLELARILDKALEKDRSLRYQTATDLKTDLARLKRDLESGSRSFAGNRRSRTAAARHGEKSLAVLYFENLSGAKEDEHFRDGIAEDIITELSKISLLKIFSRPTVSAYRDKPVTPAQISCQLRASYMLAGSVRRAGSRIRVNAQLVDTGTDFTLWIERYDRELNDVLEVQDEIARKIAEALRATLAPREQGLIHELSGAR